MYLKIQPSWPTPKETEQVELILLDEKSTLRSNLTPPSLWDDIAVPPPNAQTGSPHSLPDRQSACQFEDVQAAGR